MAQVTITVQLSSVGADAGPFDITDNLGNTLATGVTAAELLAGYMIAGVDDSITSVSICSTGTCTNCRSAEVNLSPSLGNCVTYQFKLTSRPDSGCRTYNITADPDVTNPSFTATTCGSSSPTTFNLQAGQTFLVCLSAPPTSSIGITFEQYENDCGYYSSSITYVDCQGNQVTTQVSTDTPEITVCGVEGQYSVDANYVTATNFGACAG